MSQVQIRRLDVADAADYRAIRLAALQGDPQAFGSTYEAEAGRPLSAFAERLASSVVFGAYVNGEVVGMAGFKQREGARERHKAFVWGTYVRPDMRRQGVAEALIEALLRSAARGGRAADAVRGARQRGGDRAVPQIRLRGVRQRAAGAEERRRIRRRGADGAIASALRIAAASGAAPAAAPPRPARAA